MTDHSSFQPEERASIPGELVARLEAMTGPLGGVGAWNFVGKFSPWGSSSVETILLVDALEGSLDAALALAERVLPGWRLDHLGHDTHPANPHRWAAGLRQLAADDGGTIFFVEETGHTPALALCIAILKATTAPETDSLGMKSQSDVMHNNPNAKREG